MLTVIVFVLLASLLSGTTLVLSAVVFIVCWPFFALAVSQFTVTVADAPGASAGVSTKPSSRPPPCTGASRRCRCLLGSRAVSSASTRPRARLAWRPGCLAAESARHHPRLHWAGRRRRRG